MLYRNDATKRSRMAPGCRGGAEANGDHERAKVSSEARCVRPKGGDVGHGTEESFEFQSDYANMVHMEKELEKALDELATVHGQE